MNVKLKWKAYTVTAQAGRVVKTAYYANSERFGDIHITPIVLRMSRENKAVWGWFLSVGKSGYTYPSLTAAKTQALNAVNKPVQK
jgi:hypothetical protein